MPAGSPCASSHRRGSKRLAHMGSSEPCKCHSREASYFRCGFWSKAPMVGKPLHGCSDCLHDAWLLWQTGPHLTLIVSRSTNCFFRVTYIANTQKVGGLALSSAAPSSFQTCPVPPINSGSLWESMTKLVFLTLKKKKKIPLTPLMKINFFF